LVYFTGGSNDGDTFGQNSRVDGLFPHNCPPIVEETIHENFIGDAARLFTHDPSEITPASLC